MPVLPDSPLCFTPHYHTRVWGGRKLETQLGRSLPDAQPYGESWELSDRDDCQSVVSSGPLAGTTLHELWQNHRREIFGEDFAAHPSPRFPLLVKVLDCADVLSLQVHPPAHLAAELGGEPKSEMWHIVAAEPGAKLYAGLKQGVTRAAFETALASGRVADCVHGIEPRAGDSLMVHSGRLHALGAGLLLFEIQQNSDTTYRVFDWNRLGLDGQPRALHVAESLRCIDFGDFEPRLRTAAEGNPLAACEHFRVNRRESASQDATPGPRLIMALDPLTWAGTKIEPGRVALWPAAASPAPAIHGGTWLEIQMG
ncbi:MAG: class I mannose-6-phosphate isomerase [Verrucomicrobiales bacterium]|nr:class I mannose-6-phosphate isomerase [Verrucomicrobiales bacterium]